MMHSPSSLDLWWKSTEYFQRFPEKIHFTDHVKHVLSFVMKAGLYYN